MNTNFDFKGQVAIISGGASGIGAQTALAFARAGADVIIADINPISSQLQNSFKSLGCTPTALKVDVTKGQDIETAVCEVHQQFGKIDILVHSAGIGIEKDFLETTEEEWNRIISIDLTGTFLFCQAVAKKMVKNGYGRIVTVSSTAGVRGGYGRSAYGAAKGGVISLTKTMAVELAPYGITVNTLAPGAIETELVSRMHTKDTRRIYTRAIPAGCYGTPADTANAALFLASKNSGYINGHTLAVDGGFLAAGLMKSDEA